MSRSWIKVKVCWRRETTEWTVGNRAKDRRLLQGNWLVRCEQRQRQAEKDRRALHTIYTSKMNTLFRREEDEESRLQDTDCLIIFHDARIR